MQTQFKFKFKEEQQSSNFLLFVVLVFCCHNNDYLMMDKLLQLAHYRHTLLDNSPRFEQLLHDNTIEG
jgi:hypothetical protein